MPYPLIRALTFLLGIGVLIGVPVAVYVLFRMICRPNLAKTFADVYNGIAVSRQPFPGSVNLRFHTYHGFVFHKIQTEHSVWAKRDDAMQLLQRLHRFNLTHGFFAYGALVMPILSWFNYRSEAKRIKEQSIRS